jgi:serine/threonine protein kinase
VTDEQWPRVKALFHAALERPAEERWDFLVRETDDERVRRDVESLLVFDAADPGLLDRLPMAHAPVLAELLADQSMSVEHATHATLKSGSLIGPYRISTLIGVGAMGEVYRARDTRLHRDVALKVLPERRAFDPECLARFTREAQLLATVTHQNIAVIHGIEESGPTRALVLELVDGPTLAERIADAAGSGGAAGLPVDEVLAIARQVAEGHRSRCIRQTADEVARSRIPAGRAHTGSVQRPDAHRSSVHLDRASRSCRRRDCESVSSSALLNSHNQAGAVQSLSDRQSRTNTREFRWTRAGGQP